MNTYAYVGNNSLKAFDPLGLDRCRYDRSEYTYGWVDTMKPPEEVGNWDMNIPKVEWKLCGTLPEFGLPRGGPPVSVCAESVGYWHTTFTMWVTKTISERTEFYKHYYLCFEGDGECSGRMYEEIIKGESVLDTKVIDSDYFFDARTVYHDY